MSVIEGLAYIMVGAAIALGITGYVFWTARENSRPPSYPERRTVVVNLLGDEPQAIRGVLWETTREHLVLKGAELLTEKPKPTPMDGDVIVFRNRVAWLQVVSV